MDSTSEISQLIKSILSFPVEVNSSDFRKLKSYNDDKKLLGINEISGKQAFIYCYLCNAFTAKSALNKEYLGYAKNIIKNNSSLIKIIFNDIINTCKSNFINEDLVNIEKRSQLAYSFYELFAAEKNKDICMMAFEAAFVFLIYISNGIDGKFYLDCADKILNDSRFITCFLFKRINSTMKDQRTLSTADLSLMQYVLGFFDKKKNQSLRDKATKGMVGYTQILYMAEQYRVSLKKYHDLLSDKYKPTFFSTIINNNSKIFPQKISEWSNKRKKQWEERIQVQKNNIRNYVNQINKILSDVDIKQFIKKRYRMFNDHEYVNSLIDVSDIYFYKTGSTSIILKFKHNEKPLILKLVKPCFCSNEKIKNDTAGLKDYYNQIDKDLQVYISSARFAIMKFIEGRTITEFIATKNYEENKHQYVSNIKSIISCIIESLRDLHTADYFHKDLSKDNIIISNTNTDAKFIDYGQNYVIADVSSADQYADISISIAPEVLSCLVKNEYDFIWADLYSLGIIILELYNNKIAKDKNVLATLLDETWKRSPSLAYLVELLIDGKVENRKSICDILNSDSHLLKNLLPDVTSKSIKVFDRHIPGKENIKNKDQSTEDSASFEDQHIESNNNNDMLTQKAVGLHDFLRCCFDKIFDEELNKLTVIYISDSLIMRIACAVIDFFKHRKITVKHLLINFLLAVPMLIVVLSPHIRKLFPQRVLIKDYLNFWRQLNTVSMLMVFFVSIGFFSRLFHDIVTDNELLSSLSEKWTKASNIFFSFLPDSSSIITKKASFESANSFYDLISWIFSVVLNFIEKIYDNYFYFIYNYYTPENWDIVLSALIVGTTFVMCATPYYRIIFSNISFLDFFSITAKGLDLSKLTTTKRLFLKSKAFISEAVVRLISFIHVFPILYGMCYPSLWARCSWVGVIPVTLNSFINSKFLNQTYKIYTDQKYFILPISNAVKETVDKFLYWHVLLTAYIVVLLVGDFGLRGGIFKDWLMYSFLVAVVNVVKMQFFNCYKEGPGVHATIYRCYAACLRSKYITKLSM